ncbi:hypothetical protein [Absidia glauca]|uniref:Reverse transcriptase domain-containing protein n=1 Tax=Absidia glauca TaxID=4829 RepID=A0A163LV02_ABSGL|nr:hypothetical protein [Absidia glauca]
MEIEPEIDEPQGDYDFYAATRSERPPEIMHDDKATKKRKVHGPENLESRPPHVPMETDRPNKKPQKRANANPPNLKYNLADDVLSRKADIEVRDLIAASPMLKKQLLEVCRPKRQNRTVSLNAIEEGEIVTTAAYAEVHVAAKSCISRTMMKMLDMEIDAQSTSVFTLGNGSKQPTLGIVLDVPIGIADGFNIPDNMEVLPQCPAHLILGIDWLNHAQAIINIKLGTLTVTYKQRKMVIPITYIKASSKPPTLKASNMIYKETELVQTPQPIKKVVPLKDQIDEDEDEDDSSDDETEEEEWEHDEKEESEDDDQELCQLTPIEQKDYTLKVTMGTDTQIEISTTEEGFTLPPYSMCLLDLSAPDDRAIPTIIHMQPDSSYEKYLTIDQFIDVNLSDQDKDYPPNTILAQRMKEIKIDSEDEQAIGFELAHMAIGEDVIQTEQQPLDINQMEKLQVGDVPSDIRESLLKLLSEFQDVFDWHNDRMGRTTLLDHEILLKENTPPIRHRPYRMAPVEQEYLKKELDRLCDLGIIKPANTPFTAPIILVKKKNGDYRMVVDYRKLNAQTKVDAYPLPKIDDLIDELGNSRIFSALDLRSGFHQVPLKQNSKELTGFVTKFGTYQYEMLPMGLVNSPATFQRLIDLCFGSLLNKCLVAYIDDLNIHSRTLQQHLKDLRQVFICARHGGLLFNIDKCTFFKEELKFLGYIITKKGISTDKDKILKIQEFPQPKTLKQIRSFIGLASYYRRFIQNFAAIARPLHEQTKTTKVTVWDQKATDAFKTLKQKLTNAPVLRRADFSKPFVIVCDASQKGLGTILSQLDEDGKEHPVIYASRGLKNSERNYGATKLECLALIWSLHIFRPYLLGRKFTVISNHSPLKWLVQSPKITGIVARWVQYLADYDFEIKYRSGRKQEAADFLSRLGY